MNGKRKFLQKVVESGLECGIIRPTDVVRHASATVLAHHLPADLTAKVLDAGLGAGKMSPNLVVDTLGVDDIAKHVPTGVLWACVSECAKRSLSAKKEEEEAPKEAASTAKGTASKSAVKSAPVAATAAKSAPAAAPAAKSAPVAAPAPAKAATSAASKSASGKATSLGKGISASVTTSASRAKAAKRSPLSPAARLSPVPEGPSPFDDDETNVREDRDNPEGKDDWEDVPIATDYDILEEGETPDALVAQAAGEWGTKDPPETLPGGVPGRRSS